MAPRRSSDQSAVGLTEPPAQTKDYAYVRIRDDIVTMAFPPGMALREALLAERYGISKTPIREALVRLDKEGLVEMAKYRGARVRGYSARDIREIYDLRELLEGFCARLAARDIDEADELALERNVASSRERLAGGDVAAVAAAFDEFDEILRRQAEGHRVSVLIQDLAVHLERLGRLTVTVPGRLERSVEQHEAIARAIHCRDEPAAEAACRVHVRSVLADVMADVRLRSDPSEMPL